MYCISVTLDAELSLERQKFRKACQDQLEATIRQDSNSKQLAEKSE